MCNLLQETGRHQAYETCIYWIPGSYVYKIVTSSHVDGYAILVKRFLEVMNES